MIKLEDWSFLSIFCHGLFEKHFVDCCFMELNLGNRKCRCEWIRIYEPIDLLAYSADLSDLKYPFLPHCSVFSLKALRSQSLGQSIVPHYHCPFLPMPFKYALESQSVTQYAAGQLTRRTLLSIMMESSGRNVVNWKLGDSRHHFYPEHKSKW